MADFENYAMNGAATLSYDNQATTDNLITSAIEAMPASAVGGIMPISKTRGPTSQWVEPWYAEDKLELVTTPVTMDDKDSMRKLSFTCVAADNLRRTYTPEAFASLVQNWVLFHKHARQRRQLINLLKSDAIASMPAFATAPTLEDMTKDKIEELRTQIMHCIVDLAKDFQLDEMDFSIVAPYSAAWAILDLQSRIPSKIHAMYDDTITDIYVFPTGTANMSRAGFALFEYADSIQKGTDSVSGEEIFFVYNRSAVVLNPIHARHPIVRTIKIG